MIPLVSRSRARGLPKPIQMDSTPRGVEAASVLILILSARLWFSQIKHKASRYTARGCLIRQNNIIDLKTEASLSRCFILPSSFSSSYLCPLRPPQPTPFKTIKTCFWNVIKLRRVQLPSRPRRRLEATGVERREGGEPAWPAWRAKCRFAPWASWETPLLTVSGREAAPSYLVYSVMSFRWIHRLSQLWPHICMPAFVCVCAFSFQQLVGLQEAGLRPLLPRCFDRLPHGGSAPPLSRLLLGIHRHSSFCSPAGGPTGLLSTRLISAVDLWMHKR